MTATPDPNPPTEPGPPSEDSRHGPSDDAALLAVAAGVAAGRPECLAWVLARFQEDERMGDPALARRLGIRPDAAADVLLRLRLFLTPRDDYFLDDVDEIADACGVDADALIGVLRAVQVAERMRASGNAAAAAEGRPTGRLLAARERRPNKRKSKDEE